MAADSAGLLLHEVKDLYAERMVPARFASTTGPTIILIVLFSGLGGSASMCRPPKEMAHLIPSPEDPMEDPRMTSR